MSWCAQNHRGILIANWNLSSDSYNIAYSIRFQLRPNWYKYLYIKYNVKRISDIRLKLLVYMHSSLNFHYQYAQCNKIQMISWHECSKQIIHNSFDYSESAFTSKKVNGKTVLENYCPLHTQWLFIFWLKGPPILF